MRGRILAILAVVLACLGLFISGVVSMSHISHVPVPCGGSTGCEDVLSSSYSRVFGIPVAFFGLAGYFLLLVLAVLAPVSRRAVVLGFVLALFGALASAGLTYVSLTQIHAACQWCIGSASTMAALLVVWSFLLKSPAGEGARAPWFPALVLGAVALAGSSGVSPRSISSTGPLVVGKSVVDMSELAKLSRADLAPADAPWKGTADGKVLLVEFADYACPACRDVYGRLKKLLSDVDGIKLVYREHPQPQIRGHEASVEGSVCAQMAHQAGKFWEYVDLAMRLEAQPKPEDYKGLLNKLGVDPERGRSIAVNAVERDRALAARLKIKLTPVFVILSPGMERRATTNVDLTEALANPRVIAHITHK
jgi:uncharacterized membrane protein